MRELVRFNPATVAWVSFFCLLSISHANDLLGPMKLRTAFHPLALFPKHGYYAWINDPRSMPNDPRISKIEIEINARQAMKRILKAKWYHMAQDEMPEILIDFRIIRVKKETKIADSREPELEFVSVILDMYDASSKEPMWRSIVDTELMVDVDSIQRKKQGELFIEKMLADFPPK